ncbi:MAG TPA: carboxypeptidase-like regulatory domain-containing protein [Bryobacteraceae bacterium]|nr:carboxypeptidase-like regulatory domain-containing protein [Bryobacteraceae bacterium]
MRIGWIWLLAACPAAPGWAQAARSPFAAVSGVVLNDATGDPVRRAVVTLSTLDATPLEAVTFSESNGAFGFNTIPPGPYQLHVELDGYQQAWFGAGTPRRPPGTLKLAAGDIRYGITFRLRPLGSVSGMVLDPDGDPVANAQVRLLKAVWERRSPAYHIELWASTDERGQYRFAEVLPGSYLVLASQTYGTPLTIQPEAAPGQSAQQRAFAPVFYPDASRLSAAAPVQVAGGQDTGGIDFHLTTRAVAVLRGRVVFSGDLPANTTVSVNVYPQDVPGTGEQSMGAAATPPNFEFEISNLIAGPYVIEALLSVAGREYRTVERIELPSGGQEITLHPERAMDVTGRVDLEGGAGPAGPFHVTLEPAGFPPGRAQLEAEAQPDGAFMVANVTPGIWDINVSPVPDGGYIKAMRLGDQDVLTEDMTIERGTREPLRILVSSRGGVVTGTVTVPRGVARSARAQVLLAPRGKYAGVLSFYAIGAADDAGHFEFKGVTPGRYQLYAFEELDGSAYQDPGFLKPFEELGEAFDVPEGAHVERQTELIVADGAARRN